MQLSEAMALGRTLYEPCMGGRKTDKGKGCAIEMALAAVGRTDLTWANAYKVWRWLGTKDSDPGCRLAIKFDRDVMSHKSMTFDQLIDYVRSIEPPEETEHSTETTEVLLETEAAKQAESK